MQSSKEWDKYYNENKNNKPFVPESFIARIFLSKRPIKLLDSYNFKDKKILDVGCGDGRHIDFCNKLGFSSYGIEVSESKVNELRRKFPCNEFKIGISGNIGYDSNFFDYLMAVNSIYYLDENDTLEKNIHECSRVLQDGGVFIASFVGQNHFVFQDDSLNLHQCDSNIKMHKTSSKDEIRTVCTKANLSVQFIGEIHDEIESYDRHLYYVVAKKL